MSVNVTIYGDSERLPRFDDQWGSFGSALKLEDSTELRIPGVSFAERAEWMRALAASLNAEADRCDEQTAIDQENLRLAVEQVADSRRKRGDIASDGWCWKCKLDDHSMHRDFAEGGCYGCVCSTRTSQTAAAEEPR